MGDGWGAYVIGCVLWWFGHVRCRKPSLFLEHSFSFFFFFSPLVISFFRVHVNFFSFSLLLSSLVILLTHSLLSFSFSSVFSFFVSLSLDAHQLRESPPPRPARVNHFEIEAKRPRASTLPLTDAPHLNSAPVVAEEQTVPVVALPSLLENLPYEAMYADPASVPFPESRYEDSDLFPYSQVPSVEEFLPQSDSSQWTPMGGERKISFGDHSGIPYPHYASPFP